MLFDTMMLPTFRADGICKFQTVKILSNIPLDNWSLDLSEGSTRPKFQTITPKGIAVTFGNEGSSYPYLYLVVGDKKWLAGNYSWTCPVMALWKRLNKHKPFRSCLRQLRSDELTARRSEERNKIAQILGFPSNL